MAQINPNDPQVQKAYLKWRLQKLLKIPSYQKEFEKPLTQTEAQEYGRPYGTIRTDVVGEYALTASQRETLSDFTGFKSVVNDIENAANQIRFGKSAPEAWLQGTKLWLAGKIGTDPSAAIFLTKSGYLSFIVRGLGEKGTLATRDIDRVRPLIPNFWDTEEIIRRKFKSLRNVVSEIEQEKLRLYTTPASELIQQTQQGF